MALDDSETESRARTAAGFATTHWSVVLAAGDGASPNALAALERLCRAYWYPLYAFARRNGTAPEEAKDSTQAFFEELIEREFIRDVIRERGRFRTFLLTAFKRFLVNEWHRRRTLKRGGGVVILPLDAEATEGAYLAEAPTEESPDLIYDRVWARTVMEHALRQLEAESADSAKAREFRALSPFLSSPADPGEYAAIGQRLGLSPHAVAAAVLRLRRRYRESVRAEISHTVPVAADIDAEMRYLVELLTC
jgi:DNA-directed RNA polymerase specialized sigma24 family protein